MRADAGPGEAVLIKVNHHAGWSAAEGQIAADPIGFLLLKGASKGTVALRYGAAWPEWLGRAITLATILLLLMRAPLWMTAALALAPSMFAYAILAWHTPHNALIAEQAYARLQPPLINAGAIVDGVTMAQPPLARGSVVTIFGANFGSASDAVRVFVAGAPAQILYHGPNQVNLRLPSNAPPMADVSVEVNRCDGNSFAVQTTSP